MSRVKCSYCGASALEAFKELEQFSYKGHSLTADVEYSVCSECGEEEILPDQINRNDCRTRDAWRKADGLLTGAEIAALREKLGLTQQQAAKCFGGGANAFSKYERGEVIQSAAMDKLMRLALEDSPVKVSSWLSQHSGIEISQVSEGYSNVISLIPRIKRRQVDSDKKEITKQFQEMIHG